MKGTFTLLLAAVLGAIAWTSPARADADLEKMVDEAVKAYMEDNKLEKKDSDFRAYWKNGFRLDTHDKHVKLKFGGRIMFDAAFYLADDYETATGVDLANGVEFRRLRLYNSGQIGRHVKYKAQLDFAGAPDEFSIKDAYIDFVNLKECFGCPFPNVRVGHFKVPFSLEELTSSKYITFMERSLPNVFAPGRLSGLAIHDSLLGEQLNYGLGWFAQGTEDGEDGPFEDNGWSVAGRVTWTPWYDCECKCKRWHIGASAVYSDDIEEVRYRARPESHVTGHRPVDTGTFDASSTLHYGVETALIMGPWHLQAEYIMADIDSAAAGDPSFSGWYAFAGYWITGECSSYKKGTLSRVVPCCDFLDEDCCCKGGLQVAFRVSSLNLNDGNNPGGEITDYTLGLNWHLNPNARVMFNVVHADVDSGRGGVAVGEAFQAVQVRFQIDW